MYSILVSGHYPAINQKDVARNVKIKIYLDSEIDQQSVKYSNLTVLDYLYNPVKGTVGWDYENPGTQSGVANVLTFQPDTYLDPETTYNVYVNKYPDSVKSVDDKWVQDTYTFTFFTGIDILEGQDPTAEEILEADLDQAVDNEDWCTAAELQAILDGEDNVCGSTIPESDIILPDNLELISTYPITTSSDIPLNQLRYVKLSFNDSMPASGIDYSDYITVNTKDVLE